MPRNMYAVYVPYEEAQRLIPVFEYYAKHGPQKGVRGSASRILQELRNVRALDYKPLPGAQVFLTEDQQELYLDARDELL